MISKKNKLKYLVTYDREIEGLYDTLEKAKSEISNLKWYKFYKVEEISIEELNFEGD